MKYEREKEREMYVLTTTWKAVYDERDRRTGLTVTFLLGRLTRDSITHLNPPLLKG